MGILEFFVVCLVIGGIVWLIQTYAPIPPAFKQVALWAGLVVILVILLRALGILGHDWPIPHIM